MELSFEMILAIIGTIATIFLGILGIRYTLRYRNKIQLSFINNSCISLFKAVIKNLDEIEIKFKGKTIDENLILFKGTIFNVGNIDIDKSIVHKPVSVKLPHNYKWIQSQIIDSTNGLKVKDRIDDDSLIFEWDLLKKGEYFIFDTIVEYKSDPNSKTSEDDIARSLSQSIKFEHRITNLSSLTKEKLPSKPTHFFTAFFVLYILGIATFLLYNSFGQFIWPKYDLYYSTVFNGKEQRISIDPVSQNSVMINGESDNLDSIFTTEELQSRFTNKVAIEIQKSDINNWWLFLGGVFSLMMLYLVILLITDYLKQLKLYKKMRVLADKYGDISNSERESSRSLLFPFK